MKIESYDKTNEKVIVNILIKYCYKKTAKK